MFGKIIGRFFLEPHCGLKGDDEEGTVTVSELVETFLLWPHWKNQLNGSFKKLNYLQCLKQQMFIQVL